MNQDQDQRFHPAGWFADPWRQAPLRWWDGSGWTAHTCGQGAASPTASAWLDVPVAPQAAVDSAANVARWLALAVVASPLVYVTTGWLFSRGFQNLFRAFDELQASTEAETFNSSRFTQDRSFGLLQLLGMYSWLPLVLRMVWTHRITTASRSLGRLTRHTPGMACATWIIPIVSLWMPYQAVNDAFPRGLPPRTPLAWWWAAFLISPFAAMLGGVLGQAVGGPAGLAVLGGGLALGIAGMLVDRRVIASVTQAQRETLSAGQDRR